MDGKTFDTITQGLTEEPTRRRLLTGLLGGASLLTGALVVSEAEAKRGKGKKKGKGKGKGKGKTKVFICHRADDDTVELIRVGSPAVKAHVNKHGDTVCGEAGTCQTGDPTDCDQTTGACTFALVPEGTECTVEDQTGTCDAAGVCVV